MKLFVKTCVGLLSSLIATASFAGTYEVPFDGNVFNVFEIGASIKTDEGDVVRLRYHLPKGISGENQVGIEMDLVETSPMGVMRFAQAEPLAEAHCMGASEGFICMVSYDPSIVKYENAAEYLRTNFENDGSLGPRLEVAMAFSQEGIGILKFVNPDDVESVSAY